MMKLKILKIVYRVKSYQVNNMSWKRLGLTRKDTAYLEAEIYKEVGAPNYKKYLGEDNGFTIDDIVEKIVIPYLDKMEEYDSIIRYAYGIRATINQKTRELVKKVTTDELNSRYCSVNKSKKKFFYPKTTKEVDRCESDTNAREIRPREIKREYRKLAGSELVERLSGKEGKKMLGKKSKHDVPDFLDFDEEDNYKNKNNEAYQ